MLDIEEFTKSDQLFDGHYKLLRPLSTDGELQMYGLQ